MKYKHAVMMCLHGQITEFWGPSLDTTVEPYSPPPFHLSPTPNDAKNYVTQKLL